VSDSTLIRAAPDPDTGTPLVLGVTTVALHTVSSKQSILGLCLN
jgi:hypothetical protein